MAVLHTLSEHSAKHGHLWCKFSYLLLDRLSHLNHLHCILVSEELQVFVDRALSITNRLLKLGWVNREEIVSLPSLSVALPVVDSRPKLVEWSELLEHLFDILVGRLLQAG